MSLFSVLEKIIEKVQFNIRTGKGNTSQQKTNNKDSPGSQTATAQGNGNSNLNYNVTNSNNSSISMYKKSDLEPIKITDLVTPNHPELRNKEFINKEIWGPAIIVPSEGVRFAYCGWDSSGLPMEANFITLQDNSRKAGLIELVNCKFENCIFKGVAIAAPAEDIEAIIKEFKQST